jgi:thioredoxin reductase (NADPH)
MNENETKTVIKFSAQWCAPCRVYADTFKKASEMEEYKDIEFKSIDIENDEDGELMVEKYQVKSVPTTILADKNGDVIYKLMGNVPLKDLTDFINKTLEKE